MGHPRLSDLLLAIAAYAFMLGAALFLLWIALQWCVAQIAAFGGPQ